MASFKKNFRDLVGQRFGRLTAVEYFGRLTTPSGSWRHAWRCRCDCGVIAPSVSTKNLLNGTSASCGCLARETTSERVGTHGLTGTGEYRIWSRMHERCESPTSKDFANYGGRGIRVCRRWSDPVLFILDMGARPTSRHSIERRDNSLGYSPGNCYWAVALEQCNNKRNNRLIEFQGQTQTLAQWARQVGVSQNCLSRRLDHYGWPLSRALQNGAAFRKPRSTP